MNPAQLLSHFDRLSDAPDAITRLRWFILELAVRGKLVEQDPWDEPAPELLKRIQAKKERLVKAGKIKELQPLTSVDGAKTPYEIPSSWEWVPLGETVNSHLGGGTPSKNNSSYWDGDIFWASVKDVGKRKYIDETIDRITEAGLADSSSNLIPPGNLIIVTRMGLGKLSINRVPIAINQDLRALSVSSLSAIDYHYIFFKTHGFEGTGLTVKGIRVEELLNIAFPLPPLAEQHRIVAKVGELMTLCDRLEAAQTERESRRDRLVASSLNRLNSGEVPDVFREHARFYFNHLPRLTTRLEHIQQLRQSILKLAVRGKLLPQDSSDEPASESLARVKPLERPARYSKRSTELIVGDCGLSIGDPKTPLPTGWIRPPLIKIARIESGHTPSRNRPDWWGGSISWIGLVDARIHNGGMIHDTIQHTNEKGIANSAARILPAGTVCFSRTASVGYVVIMGTPMATSQDFVNWVPTEVVDSRWLQLVFLAEKPAIGRFSKGTVHQTIYYPAWLSMYISLPPLAEQQRIVAKIDELMAFCDKLETQLTTTQTESRRLLEAVLHEAIEQTA